VVIRAKNNKNNSIKAIKKTINKQDPIEIWNNETRFESVKICESTFEIDKVEQPLRFIKYALKYPDGKHSQIMIVTTCMEMSLKTLFKMIQARWNIENSMFNNLKTKCGLEQPATYRV